MFLLNRIDKMKNITDEMYSYIQSQLKKIEKENNITLLYAIESGNRGWGFSNEESDYDVRFIFKRPLDYYLSITKQKDTIDYFDGDLDYVGWDVKKALYLHWKSNPNLREWIKQKIVYYGDCNFLNDLPSFNPDTLKHYYGSIANNNWKKFVIGKENEMTKKVTKMYIYAIRCIFSWILIDEGIDAPIEIDELMKCFNNRLDTELLNNIEKIIEFYKNNCSSNQPDEKAILNVSNFIDKQIKLMNNYNSNSHDLPNIEIYNERFRKIIND